MNSNISTFNIWWLAIRPRTLIASISPVLVGSSLTLRQGMFSSKIFFLTLSFAMLIQIGTNFANDYFDFLKGSDTKQRIGPIRVTQMGLVSKKTMKIAIFSVFLACSILGVLMTIVGGYVFFILALLAIIFGIGYTAGPFPLAYKGLGDIFVLIFFGPIAVLGCNFLYTHELSFTAFLAGIGPGLFSCAILSANNIRDIEEDKKAKKNTLAVRFGKKFAIAEYIFCVVAALFPPLILYYYEYTSPIAFANIGLIFLMFEPINSLFSKDNKQIAEALPKTAHIMTIYSLIFSLSILTYEG